MDIAPNVILDDAMCDTKFLKGKCIATIQILKLFKEYFVETEVFII